jgi:tRNA pseudouridine32 synthase/23S rRNA pseudouridine746 synthase
MTSTLSGSYSPPVFAHPEILYIDDYLIVVNKPAGLLSVPGRGEDKKDCLLSRVQLSCPEALTVHRLDMVTSGIMIFARSKQIHAVLSKLFELREINKEYTAVVDGIITGSKGKIDLPLITDWPNRPRQKVDFESGKPSLTHYTVLLNDTSQQTTRLKLEPVTGRSHQLRVHLLTIGHVIIGDELYAEKEIAEKSSRLLLHANRLSFKHPENHLLVDIECQTPF